MQTQTPTSRKHWKYSIKGGKQSQCHKAAWLDVPN